MASWKEIRGMMPEIEVINCYDCGKEVKSWMAWFWIDIPEDSRLCYQCFDRREKAFIKWFRENCHWGEPDKKPYPH